MTHGQVRSALWVGCIVLLGAVAPAQPEQAVTPEGMPVELTSGEFILEGRFFPAAESPPAATVLLLLDLPGSDVARTVPLDLGAALSRQGIHVLTFNYRGTHGSDGFFTLGGAHQDIDAARRWLSSPETASQFGIDPDNLVLGGHGFGGGMALAYSSTDLAITAVFAIAPFDLAAGIARYARDPVYARALETSLGVSESGPVRWERGDFSAFIKEALQSIGRWDLALAAPQLARKRLLLAGGLDDVEVPIEDHVLPLYRTLRALGARELDFRVYQDGHEFREVRARLAETLSMWTRDQ